MDLPPIDQGAVETSENLSRFLLFSRWFSKVNDRVKADAFVPNPHIELSVSRTDSLDEDQKWSLGKPVAEARQKTLYGRADITATGIRNQKLDVVPAEPPVRHANIIGWPDSTKAAQKAIALELAASAKLRLSPN
ncbi:MAG: hypothetical protein ACI8T1_004607 [Verrucomicrobiales bacterium]|jgi:hypothetical protein